MFKNGLKKFSRSPTLKGLRSRGAGVLENTAILYFVFLISIAELVFFAWSGDLKSAVVFLLTGFLVAFFNKNMIVVLFFALVVSTIYKYGLRDMTKMREGMRSRRKKFEGEDEEEGAADVEGYEELMEKLEDINLSLENSIGKVAAAIPKKSKKSGGGGGGGGDDESDDDSDEEEVSRKKKGSGSGASKTVEKFGEEAVLSGSDSSSSKSMSEEILKKNKDQMNEIQKYNDLLKAAKPADEPTATTATA